MLFVCGNAWALEEECRYNLDYIQAAKAQVQQYLDEKREARDALPEGDTQRKALSREIMRANGVFWAWDALIDIYYPESRITEGA